MIAASRDYLSLFGVITLTESKATEDVSVILVDDVVLEGQESFILMAAPISNITTESILPATVTINDNDSESDLHIYISFFTCLLLLDVTIGFEPSALVVMEPNRTATVTVILRGMLAINASVMFSTQDGTATCKLFLMYRNSGSQCNNIKNANIASATQHKIKLSNNFLVSI